MDKEPAVIDTPKYVLGTVKIMLRSLHFPIIRNNWSTMLVFCVIIGNLLIMQVAHVTYMSVHITELEKMADTCSTVSTTFQGIFKITNLYMNQKRIRKMLKIVTDDFWPTYIAKDKTRDSLNKISEYVEKLMLLFYVLIFFCCSLLLIPPLYLGVRELPLASIYPFNWRFSPLYETMYVWQWFMNLYGVCFVVGSHDFLFLALMVNLIIQFRLLQEILSKIGTDDEQIINKMLLDCSGVEESVYVQNESKLMVKCVQHHIKLMKFADILEETFSPIVFQQFAESVSGLCLAIFLMSLVDGVNFLKIIFSALGHLVQLYMYCYAGNEIAYQSEKVSDAAFDCEWYKKHCTDLRKGLILLIQRSQRGTKIRACGMADLNILSFIAVLRSSFSFSTLFKTMIEKQNRNKPN